MNRPANSIDSAKAESRREWFVWDACQAIHMARLALRFAKSGCMAHAHDCQKWAYFHSGRVSFLACDRQATRYMLRRAATVQNVLSYVGGIVANAASVRS